LEVLTTKVEALQGAATATTAVLAEAEVNFKAAASRADALQQKLTDANAKVVAHSELRAQLAEATERVSALEESLAASRQQAAAYEKAAAKLTAAEHELEILRETAGLQSSALKDALARLPQLEVLTTKVEALQGAATATTAVLAEAEASFKAAASRADALQQKLTDANAKTAAHSELRAQLTAATERVSALEENLAASRQQAAAYENATARLTAAEQELQLLRRTVRLQTDALEEAAPRLPQLDKLTSQVKKLELETVTLGQKLATANGDLRVGHARRGSLESELEDLRHEARFARIASTGGLVGVLRSLPLGQNKRTTAAIRYPRPDTFVPSEVHIRDDWTDSLHVGQGGERIGSEIVSRRKSGHVFFGPYAALPAGSYAADVQINLRSGLFKSQGYSLEIVARDEVIASSNLELARGYNRFLMPFRISNDRGVSEIEVRLYSPGTNDIALKKLRLLESLSIASAPEQNTATSAPSTDAGAMPGVQSAAARAS
ncbi:MAG: hypothetical protein Q8M31_06760, partial [Beijerinckiaceae bacterium]|nr:hypothetical protein [Beijerinckiaceae bacterium]